MREHTHALITELQRSGRGPERKLFRTVLEDALISVILGLPGTRDGGFDVEPDLGLAPWAVRRAEEYMAAHAADPISLSELVAVCCCSESGLHNAFKSSRGYTPMQFLMSRRLELARERLIQQADATATEIALDCGFINHGRFAKAYRHQYGELPSETHDRHHGPMRR